MAEQLALDTSETLPQHKAMSRCRLSHDPLSLTQTLPALFGLPLQPTVDRCAVREHIHWWNIERLCRTTDSHGGRQLGLEHDLPAPLIARLDDTALFLGALSLTAITDNAALTYLGSLSNAISDDAKYWLVAGAVAGGGLTVIANAPNPAGASLLEKGFADESISAGGLLAGALLPTAIAASAFVFL